MLITVLLMAGAVPARAEENAMKDVFVSGFYGGLAGALVGAAVLAFSDKPSEHTESIGYGAAGGVIAGTLFGIVRAMPLTEMEDGKVWVQFPTPRVEMSSEGWRQERPRVVMDLITIRF
jgi:hypothetical protein